MKTPVVIGIVVALHCVALGTLLMTQGCGTSKGRSGGPVQFQDKPAVLPKPAPKEFMPETVAKPHPKQFVKVEDPEFVKPGPAEKTEKIEKKVKSVSSETKSYTVKKGDSLGYIAQRFKVSINEIKELNPSIKKGSLIRDGQVLKLPVYVNLNAPAPKRHIKPKPVAKPVEVAAPVAGAADAPIVAAGEYVVVSGDFPEKIAKKCGVKMDDLMKANKITDPKKLKIGQKLVIPGAAAVAPAPLPMVPVEPAPIAPFNPTSPVPALAPLAPVAPAMPGGLVEPAGELRPIAPLAPAAPGLKPLAPAAPAPAAVPAAPAMKSVVMQKHMVAPGETMKDIAMLYTVTVGDIMRVNGMTSDTVVPGQSLNIPPAQ
jgi:LysM repeat protein